MLHVAPHGLILAPRNGPPMGCSGCSNYFFELEPRYGIEP
jgi:hypothetical protein